MVHPTMTREALTIRFPAEVLEHARRYKTADQSLNDFVVTSVEREARRRQMAQALDALDENRERIAARAGVLPDSTPMIRQLREGIGRR
ncbi:hypothetical protein BH18CHL2_BH18CHL2_10520 [soil metagenome]